MSELGDRIDEALTELWSDLRARQLAELDEDDYERAHDLDPEAERAQRDGFILGALSMLEYLALADRLYEVDDEGNPIPIMPDDWSDCPDELPGYDRLMTIFVEQWEWRRHVRLDVTLRRLLEEAED